MIHTTEKPTVFHVATQRGFTESFDQRTVETLVALGLIEHEHDGYVIEDSQGRGAGPLHAFYRGAR